MLPSLAVPPYLDELAALVTTRAPKVWGWFASESARARQARDARLELLRSTYRMHADDSPDVFAAAQRAAESLGLGDVPITLYRSQQGDGSLNAALVLVPDEAHIVLQGSVTDLLDTGELTALFGHELGHFLLLGMHDRRYAVLEDVLTAMVNDRNADATQVTSWRLMRLCVEIFCDRAGLSAVGDLHPVVSALVKMTTGATSVSAEAYLEQAAEVLGEGDPWSRGLTHPESYIRAEAARRWFDDAVLAEDEIFDMVSGPAVLGSLDLVRREQVMAQTEAVITDLLRPAWFRSEAVVAHARAFFPDWKEDAPPSDLPVLDVRNAETASYWAHVLIDFAAADPDLGDAAIAHVLQRSAALGIDEALRQALRTSLGMKDAEIERIASSADEVLPAARTPAGPEGAVT